MPSIVWILMWVVVIGCVAWLAVREVRGKHSMRADLDRSRADNGRPIDLESTDRSQLRQFGTGGS
jgi:hypothetical protein